MTEEQVAQMIRNLLLEIQQLSTTTVALAEEVYIASETTAEEERRSKLVMASKRQRERLDSLIARFAKTK